MSGSHCARSWEAEAARDGRLEAPALTSHELHTQHCKQCARERTRLEQLATQLRAESPHSELMLRRVRQSVLAAMNQQALATEARIGLRFTRGQWVAALSLATLFGLGWFAKTQLAGPATPTLELASEPGTRFTHARRGALDYVKLKEGALSIHFNRGVSGRLIVHVPDGEIRDLGTVFRVVVRAGTTTEIAVKQGAVVLRRETEPDVLVSAGEVFLRAPHGTTVATEPIALPAQPPPNTMGQASAATDQPAQARAKTKPRQRRGLASAGERAARTGEQQDLAYLRIVALLQEARSAEARVAAQEYLSRFPDGFRRAEVERIAARLAR